MPEWFGCSRVWGGRFARHTQSCSPSPSTSPSPQVRKSLIIETIEQLHGNNIIDFCVFVWEIAALLLHFPEFFADRESLGAEPWPRRLLRNVSVPVSQRLSNVSVTVSQCSLSAWPRKERKVGGNASQ